MTLAVHPRQELLSYIPKPLQQQVNTANIKSLVSQELRQMQGYSKEKAQVGFIGRSLSLHQGPAACEGQSPEGEGGVRKVRSFYLAEQSGVGPRISSQAPCPVLYPQRPRPSCPSLATLCTWY